MTDKLVAEPGEKCLEGGGMALIHFVNKRMRGMALHVLLGRAREGRNKYDDEA